jgi:hypothetical protein
MVELLAMPGNALQLTHQGDVLFAAMFSAPAEFAC